MAIRYELRSDKTLMGLRKSELVRIIHNLQHEYGSLAESSRNELDAKCRRCPYLRSRLSD